MQPVPWRRVVVASILGTIAVVAVVLVDVERKGGNPLSLVEPGARGPSAALFAEDFPETELPGGTGHDGQQFYAVARAPMHLDAAAAHLDRPHYRLQRPLFPWLAWAIHPTGGGLGLVRAMFLVSIVAVFAGGLATGALSTGLGGPAWAAALFPILPGSYVSLRIGVADALALALAVAAMALSLRRRDAPAVVAAVGAVLAKEPVLLVLAGFAVWRRDRRGVTLVGIPVVAAGLWAVWLRLTVDGSGTQVRELTWALGGIVEGATGRWSDGDDLWALGSLGVAVVLGVWALLRTRVHTPLGWPIVLHLALLPFLAEDVITLDLNATRALMPLHLLPAVAVLSRRSAALEHDDPPRLVDGRWCAG